MMGEGGWGVRITFNVAFNLGCASTNCKTVVLWYCDPGKKARVILVRKFQGNVTNRPSNSEICNLKFVVISLAQMFSLEEE